MTIPMEQRYLSVTDAAQYLGLSPKTIYVWAEAAKIPAYKVGRVWRFDKAELDAFVRGDKPNVKVLYNPLECSGPERKGV